MKQAVEDERLIKQYLLGELVDEQQSHVQDRLLTDPEFFKLLLLLENELTDEYLSGKLSQNELERFNYYFLSAPEHRQKLKFSKALNKYVSEGASQRSRQSPANTVGLFKWWRFLGNFIRSQNRMLVFSLATVSLVLAAAGISLVVYRVGMKYEGARVRDENAVEPGSSASSEGTTADALPQGQRGQDIAKLKTEAPPAASPGVESPKTSSSQHEQKREPERSLMVKPPLAPPMTEQIKSTPSAPSSSGIEDALAGATRAQEEADRVAASTEKPPVPSRALGLNARKAIVAPSKETPTALASGEISAAARRPTNPSVVARKPRVHTGPSSPSRIESLTLTAGVARDVGTTRTAEITAATEHLLLHLTLGDGEYLSYRAELKTAEGKRVWSQDELMTSGKALMVSVAAKILVSDDYIVTLSGTSDDGKYLKAGTYRFRVVRK